MMERFLDTEWPEGLGIVLNEYPEFLRKVYVQDPKIGFEYPTVKDSETFARTLRWELEQRCFGRIATLHEDDLGKYRMHFQASKYAARIPYFKDHPIMKRYENPAAYALATNNKALLDLLIEHGATVMGTL